VTVQVAADQDFRREGDDLHCRRARGRSTRPRWEHGSRLRGSMAR
jgi:hypothetical protein